MSGTPSFFAGIGAQLFDDNGKPLSGGKVSTFRAGTTTPIAVYTSEDATTAHPNPIILDSSGRVPTGEIWLKEGDAQYYKFVVRTSADVMLDTYDFVPGTYNSDFVDNLSNTTNPLLGDNLVGFRQSNASGNLTNAVGRTVHSKLQESISFRDFGAVGNGVANDTVAIQAAVASANGKVIDGENLTYKIIATITGITSNTVIQNAIFNFSEQPNGVGIDIGFNIAGVKSTGVALTANTLVLSSAVTVGNTSGFAPDDLVFLSSTKIWDALQGVVYGQYGRVKSIASSTQIDLYEPVQLSFNTAQNALIAKITPVQNVVFRNCQFIGANNLTQTQIAIYVQYGENCRVEGSSFKYFDYTALGFFRCYKSIADKVSVFGARNAGNAYGIAIWGGSYACTVVNGFGEDTRHFVTIGDNDGINMHTVVSGCNVVSSKDAGLDSHSASMFTTFNNNIISMSSDRAGTSNHDGLIIQGAHGIITGNTVIGVKGTGISYNVLIADGTSTTVKIIGNTIVMDDQGYLSPTTTGIKAIYVYSDDVHGPDNIDSIQISNNSFSGGQDALNAIEHVVIRIDKPNSTVKNILITANASAQPAKGGPCYISLQGVGVTASKISIANNCFQATTVHNGIYLYAIASGSTFKDVNIAGNLIDVFATGVYLRAAAGASIDNARIGGNVYRNVTQPFTILGTVTDINIDSSDGSISPVTFTGSPAVIGRGQNFIFNRGAAQIANMPDPAAYAGRTLNFKNIQAQTVDSNVSNVVPIDSATAGTAILPATDGAWVQLMSDGTNWITMQRG